jgi:pimeloyl-ACP methyl ester carboxylesterase
MKTIKTADTPLLRISYEDWNPGAARCVVLLHGWPDSPRCWSGVAPLLAQQGWRVLVPALRGFAPTQFLNTDTPRTGQLSALARDLLDFVDVLGLTQPAFVGHDWGARAAANACGLRPGVASHLVMISVGYGTNSPAQALSLTQARNYWYHWYMATPRGERSVREDRREMARILWNTWAPPGWYHDDEFAATAQAFDNDDWPAITLHSYRHRWGHAPSDPRYDADELALQTAPLLDVPTLILHGAADGANHPDTSAGKEHLFRGRYLREVLQGVGHFPPREAPERVAAELLQFLAP